MALKAALPAVALLAALAGCARYAPLPLEGTPALARNLADLRHDGVALGTPLSLSAIARLAVENDPDLRAARYRRGVAQAQVLEAGLLPNPSLTGGISPNITTPQATTTAWFAGLTQDVKSLATLSARRAAARENARQVDAALLWQEWQVIAKARLLAVDLIEGTKYRQILVRTRALLAESNVRAEHAVQAGNLTLAAAAPGVAALQATEAQLDAIDQQQQSRRHQLNALLGLVPEAEVPLASSSDLPPLLPDQVRLLLPRLAERRPDLVALRLGYRAQEATLRGAILAQFPALALGVTGGIDNTNDYYVGPGITMDLPIFDRNQGNIAIATATRQQLHEEYAARLAAAAGEVRAMLDELPLLETQLARLRRELAGATRTAERAEAAFQADNLDQRSYVDLVSTRLAKEQEIVTIEQSLLERQVAMATLTGAGMPPVAMAPDGAPS